MIHAHFRPTNEKESVLATPQLNQAQQNQSQQIQAQQYTPGNLPSHSAVAPLLTNLCDILESKVYQCPTCLTMFTGVNGKEQIQSHLDDATCVSPISNIGQTNRLPSMEAGSLTTNKVPSYPYYPEPPSGPPASAMNTSNLFGFQKPPRHNNFALEAQFNNNNNNNNGYGSQKFFIPSNGGEEKEDSYEENEIEKQREFEMIRSLHYLKEGGNPLLNSNNMNSFGFFNNNETNGNNVMNNMFSGGGNKQVPTLSIPGLPYAIPITNPMLIQQLCMPVFLQMQDNNNKMNNMNNMNNIMNMNMNNMGSMNMMNMMNMNMLNNMNNMVVVPNGSGNVYPTNDNYSSTSVSASTASAAPQKDGGRNKKRSYAMTVDDGDNSYTHSDWTTRNTSFGLIDRDSYLISKAQEEELKKKRFDRNLGKKSSSVNSSVVMEGDVGRGMKRTTGEGEGDLGEKGDEENEDISEASESKETNSRRFYSEAEQKCPYCPKTYRAGTHRQVLLNHKFYYCPNAPDHMKKRLHCAICKINLCDLTALRKHNKSKKHEKALNFYNSNPQNHPQNQPNNLSFNPLNNNDLNSNINFNFPTVINNVVNEEDAGTI